MVAPPFPLIDDAKADITMQYQAAFIGGGSSGGGGGSGGGGSGSG